VKKSFFLKISILAICFSAFSSNALSKEAIKIVLFDGSEITLRNYRMEKINAGVVRWAERLKAEYLPVMPSWEKQIVYLYPVECIVRLQLLPQTPGTAFRTGIVHLSDKRQVKGYLCFPKLGASQNLKSVFGECSREGYDYEIDIMMRDILEIKTARDEKGILKAEITKNDKTKISDVKNLRFSLNQNAPVSYDVDSIRFEVKGTAHTITVPLADIVVLSNWSLELANGKKFAGEVKEGFYIFGEVESTDALAKKVYFNAYIDEIKRIVLRDKSKP